ncbi:hypothetical protein [Microcoleus phage My-WqHQDG]|nr:hypothetical protein [Microcoleus phage My-WqHQDG]
MVNLFSNDLSNEKLDGQYFGNVGNLDGVNLSKASLRGANFMEVSMRRVNLTDANLCGAELGGANLAGATMKGANLKGASLDHAKLDGVDLRGTSIGEVADIRCASLRGCNLSGMHLDKLNLEGCDLTNADLSNCYLIGTNLRGTTLRGTILTNARISDHSMYNTVTFGIGDYKEPPKEYFINTDKEVATFDKEGKWVPPGDRKGVLCFMQGPTTYYLVGMHRTTTQTYGYWDITPHYSVGIFDMVKVYRADCEVLQISIGITTTIKTELPHDTVEALLNSDTITISIQGVYFHMDREVMPNDIKPAVPKPVLKPHTITEWAFKMGTVCKAGTPTPNWGTLTLNKGHQWVATSLENSYHTEQTLSDYFNLGTHCEYGTPYNLVRSTADNGIILSTTPMPKQTAQRCVGLMAVM